MSGAGQVGTDYFSRNLHFSTQQIKKRKLFRQIYPSKSKRIKRLAFAQAPSRPNASRMFFSAICSFHLIRSLICSLFSVRYNLSLFVPTHRPHQIAYTSVVVRASACRKSIVFFSIVWAHLSNNETRMCLTVQCIRFLMQLPTAVASDVVAKWKLSSGNEKTFIKNKWNIFWPLTVYGHNRC